MAPYRRGWVLAQSMDDFSPGMSLATAANFTNTSPLNNENVYGTSAVAWADLDQAGSPVTLSYGQQGDAPAGRCR